MFLPKDATKILIILLRIAAVFAFLGIVPYIIVGEFGMVVAFLLTGIINLFLAQGLSLRKRWAWLVTLIFTCINFVIYAVVFLFFSQTSTILPIFGIVLSIVYLELLWESSKMFSQHSS